MGICNLGPLSANAPNDVWLAGLTEIRTASGPVDVMIAVDMFTRLPPLADARKEYGESDVVDALERAASRHGMPKTILLEYRRVFGAQLEKWAEASGVTLGLAAPASPILTNFSVVLEEHLRAAQPVNIEAWRFTCELCRQTYSTSASQGDTSEFRPRRRRGPPEKLRDGKRNARPRVIKAAADAQAGLAEPGGMRFHCESMKRPKAVARGLKLILAYRGTPLKLMKCQEVMARIYGFPSYFEMLRTAKSGRQLPSEWDVNVSEDLVIRRRAYQTDALAKALCIGAGEAMEMIRVLGPTGRGPLRREIEQRNWGSASHHNPLVQGGSNRSASEPEIT